MGCLAVACGEAPKLFEPVEATFDAVAQFVQIVVVGALDSAVALGGDDGFSAHRFDVSDQFAAIVALVGEHRFRVPVAEQVDRFGVIAALAG
jgi:hypothetical protein